MARTLIGQLVLRLQEDVSGRAKKVESSLRNIEKAARNLDKGGWGAKFQRDLDRFGRSASDIDKVRSSWDRLQRAMADGKIDKALRTQQIASWKAGVLSSFAQVEARMRSSERQARATGRAFSDLLKIGAAGVGLGTGSYVAGRLGAGGIRAGAELEQQKARATLGGLSEPDRAAIRSKAYELAPKYGLYVADVFETIRDAALNLPTTSDALASSDNIARFQKMLSTMWGSERAKDGVRAFIKALDNTKGDLTPQEIQEYMDAFVRAQYVEGKDLDAGQFAMAMKYARAPGKLFSDEFRKKWMPAMIPESAGSDTGTQLRSTFNQLYGSKATDEALLAQTRWGVRENNGKFTDNGVWIDSPGELKGKPLFLKNPIEWVNTYVRGALETKGLDLQNGSTENLELIADAVSKMFSDRLAADFVTRSLLNWNQYQRKVNERYPKAAGLDQAETIDKTDPFAAWNKMIDSLRNLSAAVGEHVMPMIVPGLNALANAINAMALVLKDADSGLVALGTMGAGALGAYAGIRTGAALLGGLGRLAGVAGAGAVAGGGGLAITGGASFSIAGPVTITALGTLGLMHANQNAFGVPGGSVSQGGPILGALDSTGSLVDAINKAGDTKPSGRDIIGEWVATLPGKIFEGITGGSRDLRRFLSKDPLAGNLVMPLWDEANDSKLDRLRRNFPYKPGEGYRGKSFADRVAGGEGLDLSGALRRWFWHEGADRPGATMRSGIAAAEEAAAEGLRSLDAYMRRGGDLSDAGAAAGSSFKTALAQEIDEAVRYAEAAGQRIRAALSITATPTVDTSGIQSAVNLAQRVRRLNADFGPAPA